MFVMFLSDVWFLSDVCLLLFSNLCISICCKVTFVFCSIKLFYFVVQFRIDLYDPLLLSLRLFHGFSVSCIPLTLKRYCSPFMGFRTFIKFASCHTHPPFLSITGSYSAKNYRLFKKKNRINLPGFCDCSLIPIYTPGRKWVWGRGWARGNVIIHRIELHCIVYHWLLIVVSGSHGGWL